MIRQETLNSLKERRSIRKYKAEQIDPELLKIVLEAATYAPTARGTMHPRMVVVQDPETVKKFSRMNAQAAGSVSDMFYGAPTVIIVFGNKERTTYVEDASLTLGNLMNAAYAAGLGSCWIHRARQMFETEEGREYKKKWGLGDEYVGVGCCILGYPDCEHPIARDRDPDYIIYD